MAENIEMSKPNFIEDILEAVDEEAILAVVIQDTIYEDYYTYKDPRDTPSLIAAIGKVLTLEEAFPLLDYEYYDGFGSMDCHDVLVYTETKVFYIHEYDESTRLRSVPRNPTAFREVEQ